MTLARFVEAQERVYPTALREIRAGRKESHWMWFVFPQVRGLGRSAMAERFGLDGAAEAKAYLAHPVLGPRLIEISEAMVGQRARSAEEVLGGVDAMKLRSCATLFEAVGGGAVFTDIIDAFFRRSRCDATLAMLKGRM